MSDKRLDIEFNWNGLALSLFEGEFFCGEVRLDSGGYFERVWGADPPVRYLEERLLGQTELECKLKQLKETSSELWVRDKNNDHVYKGFHNDEELVGFLALANSAFDELRGLLRGKYEVNVDCGMEREYWLAGDKRFHGQKQRLWLMLDYGTWCLWLHDEYNCYIGPTELNELVNNQTELAEMISKLEEDHRGLFINNEYEFSYKGFDNRQQAEDFIKLLNDVWSGLKRVLGEKYKLYCRERLGIEDWFTEKS